MAMSGTSGKRVFTANSLVVPRRVVAQLLSLHGLADPAGISAKPGFKEFGPGDPPWEAACPHA
jgi:hypothetical protein